MSVSAIVVAAGQGRRFAGKISKPILKLGKRPVILYPLTVLNRHPAIKEIVVVANPDNIGQIRSIIKKYKIKKARKVILGSRERQDSVLNGLRAVDNQADFVLIHDGVRPFISSDLVTSLIKEARIHKAAIAGVPVKATIKIAGKNNFVVKTIDRRLIWEIQTPQVFAKKLLLKAYQRHGKQLVTDEAMLIEKLKAKVKIVLGSYNNIKITTIEDLSIAKGIAQTWKIA